MYSYHYIYDYLFVQVTEELFERDYARRIRTSPNFNTADRREQTPEPPLNSTDSRHTDRLHQTGQSVESSPNMRQRGPTIKLNSNQVFFSPTLAKDAESKSKASDGFNQADDHLLGRFRKTSTDNSHENGDYIANENTFESSDCGLQRKQDVKIQKHNVMSALQKVMQST